MKKTLKYILITSIMMMIGVTNAKAGIAHDCKYTAGNEYVHLQTMDDKNNATSYRTSDVVHNSMTVNLPDSDNTYRNSECPKYVLYVKNGIDKLYAKSTSDAKQKLEKLVKDNGYTDYFMASLTKQDGIPVSLLEMENKNDYSKLQTCEYGTYKVYVDKSASKAYITSDSAYFHTTLPEPYVKYEWFKDGCPYKLYTSGGPDNYIFSNESFLGDTIISLTSDSSDKGGSNKQNNSSEKNTFNCDSIPETTELVRSVYRTIRYLIPVLIIVLSIVDFVKVVVSGDDKEYKGAFDKFKKRLIVGIIILILPQILGMIISMSGALGMYNIDENNLFCIFI